MNASASGSGTEGQHTNCPMDYILKQLMGPWTTYILYVLRSSGPQRFGRLKKNVPGISAKMLTQRLRALEAAGLIYRDYKPTVPPQVTYGLAQRGHELQPILDAFKELGERWQAEDARTRPAEAAAE